MDAKVNQVNEEANFMLVIVMDKESNFGKQGSDISINDVLEKVKNLPEDTRVITSSELEHINAKNDMAVTRRYLSLRH